jgi:tetratricopeptide (TPR) repeat protein
MSAGAGHLAKAENEFQRLIQTQPDSPAGYMGMIQIASHQKDWQRALQLLDTSLSKFPQLLLPHGLLEKVRLLLKLGDAGAAEELCRELDEAYPDYFGGRYGKVLVAEAGSDRERALRHLDTCLHRFPGVLEFEWLEHKARLLIGQRRFEEADRLLVDLTRKCPGRPEIYIELATLAEKQRNRRLHRERWEKAHGLFPAHREVRLGYIRFLYTQGDFEKARSLCRKGFEETGDIGFRLRLIDSFVEQYQFERALREVRELLDGQPDDLQLRLKECSVLIRFWEHDRLLQAIAKLEQMQVEYPGSLQVKERLIKSYIYADETVKACNSIESLPPDCATREEFQHTYAWLHYRQGELHGAQRTFERLLEGRYYPGIHAACSLKRLDQRALPSNKSDVLLFSCIKDVLEFLPWFLEYYRNLGVDRFFIADNASTDGTTEYLLRQPDVHLFWTDDVYVEMQSGMRWINELIEGYGEGHWCMFADCDEALVFPGMETGGLAHLLSHMDSKGYEAMGGFMLDMYPASREELARYRPGGDLVSHSPYFDRSQKFFGGLQPPYKAVRGGVRRRLFGEESTLEKVPLIKGGGGIKYISAHHITPAKLSDVTGVFLHFILTQKFKFMASSEDIARQDRFKNLLASCRNRYSGYQKVLGDPCRIGSYLCEDSLKYIDSDRLVEIGLMTKPADFFIE